MNENLTNPNNPLKPPVQSQKQIQQNFGKKCPANVLKLIDPKTGAIGFQGFEFCPYCMFYSELFKKCEVKMLAEKILYNK